jgi:hypothetical protein
MPTALGRGNRYSECVSLGMWSGSSHTRLAIMKAMTCDHRPPCPAADATNAHEAHVAIWHVEQGWCLLCNGVILFEDGGAILPDCRTVEPPDKLARHAA